MTGLQLVAIWLGLCCAFVLLCAILGGICASFVIATVNLILRPLGGKL